MRRRRLAVPRMAALGLGLAAICVVGVLGDEAVDSARSLRDAVPRFIGPDEFDPNNKDYWINIGIYAAFGVVMALLSLVCCLVFACYRACCNCCRCLCKGLRKCCGCALRDDEELCCCCIATRRAKVTKSGVYGPLIAAAIFALLSVVSACVGLRENSEVSHTLRGGQSDSFTNLVPSFISSAKAQVNALRFPLISMALGISPAVLQARTVVNATADTVANGVDNFVRRVNASAECIGALDGAQAPSGTSYPCPLCATAESRVVDVVNEVNNLTSEMRADFSRQIDSFDDQWLDIEDEIVNKTRELNDTVNDIFTKVDSRQADLDEGTERARKEDDRRFLYTLILFCWPLLAFVLLVVGGVLKSASIVKVNVWVSFLACFVMWLLFAIHFPLSVVLADACLRLDKEELRVVTGQGRGDGFKAARACLLNESLVDVFNYSQELNFSDHLFRARQFNISDVMDFQEFFQYAEEFENLTRDAFEFNATDLIDLPLAELNDQLNTSFTTANISELDVNSVPEPLRSYANSTKRLIVSAINDSEWINNRTNECKANITAAISFRSDLEALLDTVQSNLTALFDLALPFIDDANRILDNARCGIVGQLYSSIKSNTCSRGARHLSVLALALFLCATASIGLIILSQISGNRIGKLNKALKLRGFGGGVEDIPLAQLQNFTVDENGELVPLTTEAARILEAQPHVHPVDSAAPMLGAAASQPLSIGHPEAFPPSLPSRSPATDPYPAAAGVPPPMATFEEGGKKL